MLLNTIVMKKSILFSYKLEYNVKFQPNNAFHEKSEYKVNCILM